LTKTRLRKRGFSKKKRKEQKKRKKRRAGKRAALGEKIESHLPAKKNNAGDGRRKGNNNVHEGKGVKANGRRPRGVEKKSGRSAKTQTSA